MQYKSWISNVSGHIFFHLSEPWNYRLDRVVGDVIHFNEKIGDERYIGVSLLADLRDFSKPNTSKYTRIIFLATTGYEAGKDGKYLNGNIVFIKNKYNSIFDEREQELLQNLHTFQVLLSTLNKDNIKKEKDSLILSFQNCQKALLDYQHQYSYTNKIQFVIQDTGIIELGEADNCISTHSSKKDEILQAYYFIKFIFHNHTHHGKTSEDIVRLTKVNVTNKKFASLMISDIKKYMVERKNQRVSLEELQGFSAYTKTLLLILNKESYIGKKKLVREEKYFDNLIDSTNVYIQKFNIPKSHTTLKDIIEYIVKVFVILMSLIAPYAILKSKEIEAEDIAKFIDLDIIPLYINGFYFLVAGMFLIDYVYNGTRSFIHQKSNSFFHYFERIIKKMYNPTLTTSIGGDIFSAFLGLLIDIIQWKDNLSFENKKYFKYAKPFVIAIVATIVYCFGDNVFK